MGAFFFIYIFTYIALICRIVGLVFIINHRYLVMFFITMLGRYSCLYLFCFFLLISKSVFAIDFFNKDKPDILWQAGLNQYIKYVNQDTEQFGVNQHPVVLNQDNIKNALLALNIEEDSFFSAKKDIKPVFTFQQVKLLTKILPQALENAKGDQDILFSLEKVTKQVLGLKKHSFIAGRVFYKDDTLNIIFGEYDFFRSKAFESVYDPSGNESIPYSFNFGSRTRKSNVFSGDSILHVVGVENKSFENVKRNDWFVINVDKAAEQYVINEKKLENGFSNNVAVEKEVAKLAKERRDMRLEMARMRKEINDIPKKGSVVSAKSIEDRINILDELLRKKLISNKEYENKRKAILGDI